MIIIYRLEDIKGEIKAIEIDRWDNGIFQGRFKDIKMTKKEVINRFNQGYWRTSNAEGSIRYENNIVETV